MTDPEFSVFAKRLFVSFPDLWEWLQEKSPDAKATQEVWRETLRACTLDECMQVLEDWISGKRQPFKAYERAQVALMIRQSVYFDRDKEAKRSQSSGESVEYFKAKRGEYKPAMANVPGLGDIFRRGKELRQRMLDGELTQEQMLEERRKLLDMVQ